jgi:lycopene cyclase domain-containing protein
VKQYTYLVVELLTIIVCFAFSFHKRIRFNRYFGSFLKAALLVAIPFIAWDIWFAATGVWWFNGSYTMGRNIAGLPVEEWLFFICIPFSCVFTFFCLDKFFRLTRANTYNTYLAVLLSVTCGTVALAFHEKAYTLVTALATMAMLVYLHFVARAGWTGKATLVYILLMPGFIAVNGVLTGTGLESPVVNYHPAEILNIRVLTIPIEDFFYGYTLYMLNLYFFLHFTTAKKTSRIHTASRPALP